MLRHPFHMRHATTAAVVLAVAAAGCSSSSTSPNPIPTHDVTIVPGASAMTTGAFTPNPLTKSLAASGKVVWFNNDGSGGVYSGGEAHHLVSDNGVFDLGVQNPGTTASFTFTAAGNYPYHCSIHPNMVGTVTITP
jgi:plastocyanin